MPKYLTVNSVSSPLPSLRSPKAEFTSLYSFELNAVHESLLEGRQEGETIILQEMG